MDTTPNGWTVVDADTGVLSYTYKFPGGTANSLAARMPDGRMFVMSPPMGVDEGVFDDLLQFGEVGAVATNNGFHHLGLPAWEKRFPDARFYASPKAAIRIAKKNKDVGALEPLSDLIPLLGDDIGLRDADGTKCGESWVWARTGGGYAWYTSDILANMPGLPKAFFVRQAFKLTGSAPGYRIFKLAMFAMVKDRKGVLRQFAQDVEKAPPSIVIPGHGELITRASVAQETRDLLQSAIG